MDGHANGNGHSKVDKPPSEMFTIIKSASTGHSIGPRLGRLAVQGRRILETPHYLATTSRGVVPHITPDTFARDTNISGIYAGLEDFLERAPRSAQERAPRGTPPIYKFRQPDGSSPFRRFTAFPNDTLLVLGARRTPPVIAPESNPNTDNTVSVCTSVGFRFLEPGDFAEEAEGLKADILVALGDISYGRALGNKRVEKATDRNIKWLQDHVALRKSSKQEGQANLFASILPVSCAKQRYYIECIADELARDVSGLAFYTLDALEDMPDDLLHFPRLGFTTPSSPHEVLRQVSLGLDIVTIPIIGAATDAGIALDFNFPASSPVNGSGPLPLGIDMWSPDHAVDLSPLSKGCECYACTNHHRAYVQHLLAAKEMLGWVLLQIHNHHTMDRFFEGLRRSIAEGTSEEDARTFERAYESRLPEKTGQGPRVRGYQYKAEGPGEPKKNQAPFQTLNDNKEKLAEATPPSADANADELQAQGFAEKER